MCSEDSSGFHRPRPVTSFSPRRKYASFEACSSTMGEEKAGFASTTEGSGSRVLEAGEIAGDYSRDWKGKTV